MYMKKFLEHDRHQNVDSYNVMNKNGCVRALLRMMKGADRNVEGDG